MRTRSRLLGALAAVAVVLAACGSSPGPQRAAAPRSTTTTTAVPIACTTSYKLAAALRREPAGTTVSLAAGCVYRGTDTAVISGTTGLTVDGNHATVQQTTLVAKGTVRPVVTFSHNADLAVSDLKVVGAATTAVDTGAAFEGGYGVMMTDNHGVTLGPDFNVSDVQGDLVALYPCNSSTTCPGGTHNALNTGITWSDSTLQSAGYHCITVEAVDGFTFGPHDHVAGCPVDAMDFENDDYGTVVVKGQPTFVAQDHVTVTDDSWRWSDDWFASLQGNVQEQDVTLSGNILNGAGPFAQIADTPGGGVNHGITNMVIDDNHAIQPLRATQSTSSTGPPNPASVMTVSGADSLWMQRNTLPVFGPTKPYLAVIGASNVGLLVMSVNLFTDAYDVLNPRSHDNTTVDICANRYGAGATETEPDCP